MVDQAQICGEGPLLLWYAAGALGEEEAAQVAAHVADCSDCRALVEENKGLAELYLAVTDSVSPHLSPETLVRVAGGEAGAEASAARAHLAGCDECQQILSVLESVQRDEDKPGVVESLGARIRSGWAAMAAGMANAAWMRSPLPAYMLVLLLLYPAYRGLVGTDADRTPNLLPAPLPVASEAERGGVETLVRVEAGDEQTVLTVFVPIAPDRYRYELELRTEEGGRLFFVEDAQSFDGVGTFALTLPGDFLDEGAYELRVGEWERESGELANEYVFPFSVERP